MKNNLTVLPTVQCSVLLKGMVVAELLKKFTPPYGIRRAVTMFKTA